MPEQTRPTAEGSFQKTPLTNVLLYARERKMTGTFVVTIEPTDPVIRDTLDVAGQSIVVLEGGNVVAVSLARSTETLGSVLHDMGLITDEMYGTVQQAVETEGADETATLLRLRAVDPVGLDKGLREHQRRKVMALFGFSEGSYAYYANVDLLNGSERARSPEDLLPVVWRALSKNPPDEATLSTVLDKIGSRAVRLREPNEIDRFEFGNELGLAGTQIRVAPSTVAQLMGLGPDPTVVRAMVYLLALTKQLEAVSEPGGAPAQAVTPPTQRGFTALGNTVSPLAGARVDEPPPPSKPPAAPATPSVTRAADDPRVKEARTFLSKMEQQTYFEMLGLNINATDAELKAAFTEKAAAWHPDRAPLPELKKVYTDIFGNFNTANTTLQDPKSREQYEASLSGGGGTPAAQKKVAAVLDTVQDVHRAEVALKRKDFAEAEKLLRRVLAANPEDYTTMLLLAQCLIEKDLTAHGDEAQRFISTVLRATENNDRALFLMGQLLKAKGDKRYLGFYKAVLEHNPRHPEALREVRLADMRKQQRIEANTTEGKIKNFFKGLLKRDKDEG